MGYSNEDLSSENLIGNRFKIKLNLTKDEEINLKNNIKFIKKYGFVNYFGNQRFSEEVLMNLENIFLREIMILHLNQF